MRYQLEKWLRDICRWGIYEEFVNWLEESNCPDEYKGKVVIYTHDNEYYITFINNKKDNKTYMGCTVSKRKPIAGETWTRGNDLPDGDFSLDTWNKIKDSIIAYELVKIAKKKRRII